MCKIKTICVKNLKPFGENTWSSFKWRDRDNPEQLGQTEFSIFHENTDYYAPSESPFMFNFRVENLVELIEILRGEGVTIVGDIEVYDYGKYGIKNKKIPQYLNNCSAI